MAPTTSVVSLFSRAALLAAAPLIFVGCSGSGSSTTGEITTGGNAELDRVEFGRLADVYGLQNGQIELYRRDVLVGTNIQDDRPAGSSLSDEEVLYDFIGANPGNLQDRLFITRDIGSTQFDTAFEALDDRATLVAPGFVGQNTNSAPFSVVPRNAAIRLTFADDLGVGDDFFVVRDAVTGQITGIKNTEAVQLLRIQGDPTQPGAFEVQPSRVTVRGNQIIIDPVLLGNEGRDYNTVNNATGMPASANQVGANMRIALALDGPLALPGLREDSVGAQTTGVNNAGLRSIIRDFRSGNPSDSSSEISRGFIRDPIAPKVVGEIVMYLEDVQNVDADTQEVTIFKDGIDHELDQGDVIRIVVDSTGDAVATAEIVADPEDDRNNPTVQHVRARVRRTPGLTDLNPRNLPGYPIGGTQAQIEEFLVASAPRAIVVAEYTAARRDPATGQVFSDDPRYFITFAPSPLPDENGVFGTPSENVSPFAAAVIRFTKPVDITTVKPLDTFFFATRDLLDPQETANFVASRSINPGLFDEDKYRIPHLVFARVFDEGSQTALRLQPPAGFYLDDSMRDALAAGTPLEYFLHLVSGAEGVRDLSGNPIDFQADVAGAFDSLVIPFTVDARRSTQGQDFFPDNLVVSVARRFATQDEDPQPSYYQPREADENIDTSNPLPNRGAPYPNTLNQPPGYRVRSQPVNDLFGGIFYSEGQIESRPPGRVSKIADNLNQQPVAQQNSDLRWCPVNVGEPLIASNTANTLFGQGIQNPLNPYGARLQTVWREIDLSLSRVNPDDFNLDIEQMYWAPFTGSEIIFDELDQVSLFLGHSEYRPEPCTGEFSALAELPDSGLRNAFDDNFVFNPNVNGQGKESAPAPHAAYVNQPLVIDANLSLTEPNGINRFLPLPEFEKPYFVYRDERVIEQGCDSDEGSDLSNNRANGMFSYILSPYMQGRGRQIDWVAPAPPTFEEVFQIGYQDNQENFELADATTGTGGAGTRTRADSATGGLVSAVGLPLLADFQTLCDRADLPPSGGYIALGVNGWQIAITLTSGAQPNFRVYSAGIFSVNSRPAQCVEPGTSEWGLAQGGFTPGGGRTASADNSFYWIWCDFLKRQTVVTNGFVGFRDPHRVFDYDEPTANLRTSNTDPRLGPYLFDQTTRQPIPGYLPRFIATDFEPALTSLPSGTSVAVEFRGASEVDEVQGTARGPWRFWEDNIVAPNGAPEPYVPYNGPNRSNFPMDPRKAGDAHIRKFDRRTVNGQSREWWTHYYNSTVTSYTEDPNQLLNNGFLVDFQGPNETFRPEDVAYFNWRFIMTSNVESQPTISPRLESFALTYRFERVQ